MRVRLSDELVFPVPQERTSRYRPQVGHGRLLFGLRPEHIMEQRPHLDPNQTPFEVVLGVTEPMGSETLVYFPIRRTEICGRVSPTSGARDGGSMKLVADLNNMHLIDDESGKVL